MASNYATMIKGEKMLCTHGWARQTQLHFRWCISQSEIRKITVAKKEAAKPRGNASQKRRKLRLVDLGRIELPTSRCHRLILPLNHRPDHIKIQRFTQWAVEDSNL